MKLKDDRIPVTRMHFQFNVYPEHTQPNGFLTEDRACQAIWYYYLIAMTARSKIGKSIDDQIIEYKVGQAAPLWKDKRFNQQFKSVAMMYGLESPDEMIPFWPNVKLEARSKGMPLPADEIVNLTGEDRTT